MPTHLSQSTDDIAVLNDRLNFTMTAFAAMSVTRRKLELEGRRAEVSALTAQMEKIRVPLQSVLLLLCDSFKAGAARGVVKYPVGAIYPLGYSTRRDGCGGCGVPDPRVAGCDAVSPLTDAEFMRLPRRSVAGGTVGLGVIDPLSLTAIIVVAAAVAYLGTLAYKAATRHLDVTEQAIKTCAGIFNDPNLTFEQKKELCNQIDDALKHTPPSAFDVGGLLKWIVGGAAVVLLGPPVVSAIVGATSRTGAKAAA